LISEVVETLKNRLAMLNFKITDETLEKEGKSLDDILNEINLKAFNVIKEVCGKLKEAGLEAYPVFEVVDSVQTFNAPCYPREYRYYENTWVLLEAVDKNKLRHYIVYMDTSEGYYCSVAWFSSVKKIYLYEQPYISNESTPFTAKFMDRIPWQYIRPIWKNNIWNMIVKLAEAEIKGNLEEAIKEVEEELKAGLWVYDYQHVYGALLETKKLFNMV